jgi:glycosyltransferase involved in cell wall biosynthesis
MSPFISVLMTSFNREKYIAAAIESVTASIYTNWELIIVDDCSKDKTVEIAQRYARRDERIKVYINENNLGDYPNRNRAASYATGKYLKYVDADDLLYPYGLEQLVFFMEQFPSAGYGLCSLPQDDLRPFPFQLNPRESYYRHYFQEQIFHKAPLSSIIRKNAFDFVGGFSHKRMVGDFDMWHKLSKHFPVVLMPHGIVWYRTHEEQEMSAHKKYLIDYVGVSVSMLRSNDCPLPSSEADLALKKLRNFKIQQIIKAAKGLQFSTCYQFFKAL